MELFTSYLSTPLGRLKLQCDEMSLKVVHFMNDDEVPEDKEFSHPLLDQCKVELTEYFQGQRKVFNLPLGQSGTPFQQKVWELLYQIPFGKTISYNQLSLHYGDLKAIRAVAAANGKNHIAIIVPCHRVIGSNQTLVGYAGGLWRKRWLLKHEAQFHHGVQELFP